MRITSLTAAVLLGGFLTSATRIVAAKEVGAPDPWASKEGAPEWVTAPPAKADAIRVVIAAQSNGLELADHLAPAYVKQQTQAEIAWRLRGLLGEAADALLTLPIAQPTFVRKAYHLDPPPRGATFPGAATYTAWTLFEVPATPILESLPAEKREEARAALALAEPSDTPAWTEMTTPPAWSSQAVEGTDAIPVVLRFSANRADVAKAQLIVLASAHVFGKIVEPLRAPLGLDDAWSVGSAATTWRRCTARAVVTGRGETTAWARFEVPLSRIVAAAPEAKREAVRAAFAPKPPPK